MANAIEIKVPDIGNYSDIPVIEVLVKAGDTVKKDQGIVTLESDKATMEVPSPADGVIKEVKVKVDDTASEGTVVAVLETGAAAAEEKKPAKAEAPAPKSDAPNVESAGKPEPSPAPSGHPLPAGEGKAAPKAASASGRKADIECQVVVLGSGPGRLHGRIPRRRSRPGHRADRALRDARRRLPQCRLHSVEGAAACRARDRGGRPRRRHRHQFRQAEDRSRQAAREQGQGRQAADRRSRRHGQAAQGDHAGHRHRQVHLGRTKSKSRAPTARSSCASRRRSSRPVRRQ